MNLMQTLSDNLRSPQGVAVRGNTLVVCNTGNHNLLTYDLSVVPPVENTQIGTQGLSATTEGLLFPAGVCFLDANNLIVADTQNRHLDHYRLTNGNWLFHESISDFSNISPEPGYIVDVIANFSGGILFLDSTEKRIISYDFSDHHCAVYLADAAWREPSAIAMTTEYLFVADAVRHQVFCYDADMNVHQIGAYGTTPGHLRTPRGLAVSMSKDYIFISEADNGRISQFDISGDFIETFSLPTGIPHECHKLATDSDGRLYVADAGANSVFIFQTDTVSTSTGMSHKEVDYGFVGIGFRLPLPIHFKNRESSDVQIQSIEIAGSDFRLAPEGTSFPISVASGNDEMFIIEFTPSRAGISLAQLKINLNIPNLPYLITDLRGDGLDIDPVSIALVLDKSGSMKQSSGNILKIERLRSSASAFIDLMRQGTGDELSIVSFSTTAQVDLERIELDSSNVPIAHNIIQGLTPEYLTSIGHGLQLGAGELQGSLYRSRNLIVLSDGKENTAPMISEFEPGQDLRIFTIGLGRPEFLNSETLEQLATETGGYFQVSDENDHLLPKFFVQIASDVLDEQIAVDPSFMLEPKQVKEIPFQICGDDLSFTIIVSWNNIKSKSTIEIGLVTPDKQYLTEKYFEIVRRGDRYLVIKHRARGSRWKVAGSWVVRLKHIGDDEHHQADFVTVCVTVNSGHSINWEIVPIRKESKKPSPPKKGEISNILPKYPKKVNLVSLPRNLRIGDSLHIFAHSNWCLEDRLLEGRLEVIPPNQSLQEMKNKYGKLDLDKLNNKDLNKLLHNKLREPSKFSIAFKPYRNQQIKNSISTEGELYRALTQRHKINLKATFPLNATDGFYRIRAIIKGETKTGETFWRERLFFVLVHP